MIARTSEKRKRKVTGGNERDIRCRSTILAFFRGKIKMAVEGKICEITKMF